MSEDPGGGVVDSYEHSGMRGLSSLMRASSRPDRRQPDGTILALVTRNAHRMIDHATARHLNRHGTWKASPHGLRLGGHRWHWPTSPLPLARVRLGDPPEGPR
jgi:hypothetical protein